MLIARLGPRRICDAGILVDQCADFAAAAKLCAHTSAGIPPTLSFEFRVSSFGFQNRFHIVSFVYFSFVSGHFRDAGLYRQGGWQVEKLDDFLSR
jgi:hypothetical protein